MENKLVNPLDCNDIEFLHSLAKDNRYSSDTRLGFLIRAYKLELKLNLTIEERKEKERWFKAADKIDNASSYFTNFEEVQDYSDNSYEYTVLFNWLWAGDDLEEALKEAKNDESF